MVRELGDEQLRERALRHDALRRARLIQQHARIEQPQRDAGSAVAQLGVGVGTRLDRRVLREAEVLEVQRVERFALLIKGLGSLEGCSNGGVVVPQRFDHVAGELVLEILGEVTQLRECFADGQLGELLLREQRASWPTVQPNAGQRLGQLLRMRCECNHLSLGGA